MPVNLQDPSFETLQRVREIQTLSDSGMIDDRELAERAAVLAGYEFNASLRHRRVTKPG